MSIETTYEFFEMNIKQTILGEATPYYTVKEVSKYTKKENNNVRKEIKKLIAKGYLIEHPLNNIIKVKKYRVNNNRIIDSSELTLKCQ